jgi:hypothetical protein
MATTTKTAPFLPVGSGNPGAPDVRSIDSRSGGGFQVKVGLLSSYNQTVAGDFGTNLVASPQGPPLCAIPANTATPPAFAIATCGAG